MNRSALNFRHFVDHLRRQGDLVDVHTEVDANLEIGAITRRVYERRAPAPLFHNIRDSLPGARVLGAPAGLRADRARAHSRLALHFGLPEHSGPRDIVAMLRAAMRAEPIAPRRLERGPVQENVWLGEQVDLTRFPVPLLHEQDGGRYFGTYGFHVVQTPDGSWDSWSVGRLMLVDRNTLAGPTIPTQHIGIIREQWRRQGKPTPWAMALGAPPAALAAAGMPLPEGVSEAGYVGALVGEPVEVVRTQTNGLWVPANAEIVLEGEISLDETALEGPMGEYHGYSFPTGKPQPLFHVHALSFRDQPILPICVAGTPPEENHTIWGTMISAQLLDVAQNAGLPVDMVWCSYEAATCWAVLSIDVQRLAALGTDAAAFAARVAETVFGSHAGHLVPKLILVGNDIDVTEIDQVVWALATRAHPLHDHFAFPQIRDFPMVPYLDAEDKARGSGGRLVINCLYPEQFAGQMRAATASFRHAYPTALRRRVEERWSDYGFADA
ncbi:UbiD family decarboxylase [Pseudomonas aeruginosa]|uniref:UbiD family decarboxylase HudA n=1 Tax=Pseudomonas aeruginosa TaxID=287 RepID=UPI001ADEEBF4|nr:UbiD family decarboxylase HudA [Pseudomonas aeruginosa]ELH7266672.1 UbiD family decarboxylase [Pseudomonas aeruginosa]ELL1156940.1 UbiD family decarboxylase [Pseudomonas aeruginosa]MDF1650681.1 UbiD family decarboxylase HudA [Pseudomonas aeruginosa]HBP6644588.1 UbiD family decarboxylase [Pseudomonas aeruginosa]HCF4511096.1 UbiD family decarboxylase [Pseudomonas aeruginosa]